MRPVETSRAWSRARLLATAFAALALRADAAPLVGPGPVLHERLEPDAREDLALSLSARGGKLHASLPTPNGPVSAPDTLRPPTASERAYGPGAGASDPGARFRPDRDTRAPSVAGYDDPFTPSVTPFKRLHAFDAVFDDESLGTEETGVHKVTAGGEVAPSEDAFYGELVVDLEPDRPAAVPTVGPGTRLLRVQTVPETPIEIVRDDAENWWARSTVRARVRLLVELAAPRAGFAAELAARSFADLPRVRPLPPRVAAAASIVLDELGLRPGEGTPAEAVRKLVAHFRAFTPSTEPPTGHGDVYLDLALSKRGVCRHRAFAFLVTARALGIPTRMVTNEAHAWVEIGDARGFHRVDLGGAAERLDDATEATRPAHTPPADPFAWPGASREGSGRALAERARAEAGAAASSSSNAPARDEPHDPTNGAPPSRVTVALGVESVRRGQGVPVHGTVEGALGPCARVRVDVALAPSGTERHLVVGSLATDESGRFDGVVPVPPDLGVGDYDVSAITPGGVGCGPGAGASP